MYIEEGQDGQQMSPELLNKVFQRNPSNAFDKIGMRSLMAPCFRYINKLWRRWVARWLHELAEGLDKTMAVMPLDVVNLSRLRAAILAPEGSPIEGYILFLSASCGDNEIPFKPLRICFTTKVWHPRINTFGSICVDILKQKDGIEGWSPAYTLETVLVALQHMLVDPCVGLEDMTNALNKPALRQYHDDRQRYNIEAKEFTKASQHGGYGKLKFEDHRIDCI